MMFATTSSSTRLIIITSSSDRCCSVPNLSASRASRSISARWLTKTAETLDIEPAQHGGRGLVEQLGAPDVLEPAQEIAGAQPLLLRATEILQHRAPGHHDEAGAAACVLRHRNG